MSYTEKTYPNSTLVLCKIETTTVNDLIDEICEYINTKLDAEKLIAQSSRYYNVVGNNVNLWDDDDDSLLTSSDVLVSSINCENVGKANVFINIPNKFLLIQTAFNTIKGTHLNPSVSQALVGGGSLVYKYNNSNDCLKIEYAGVSTNLTIEPYYATSLNINASLSTFTNSISLSNSAVLGNDFILTEFNLGIANIDRLYICNTNRLDIGRELLDVNENRYVCIGSGIFYKE